MSSNKSDNSNSFNMTPQEAQQLFNQNELDPVNMVDPDIVVENVLKILHYMQKPSIIKLKKINNIKYERHMEDAFPEFSTNFYFIFKKVISGEDITPLYGMLYQIKLVKEGKKQFENVENSVVKGLLDKFVKKN